MTKKILIMAGGTGGHVFPGIAIAKALEKQGVDIIWLGSEGGMETTLVPKADLSFQTLSITGFRGKSFLNQLKMPFILIQAVIQAYKILKKEKPDLVLGMGGFAAAPGGIAAKLLNIPLIIHEQNSISGWTNKFLSKIASHVFCAFPNTFPISPRIIITGNPVREDIQQLPLKHTLHHPPRLLISGGSRGAKILNDIVPEAIELLPENLRPEIYHQTGQTSSANYHNIQNISVITQPFIDDMAKAYDWADLVICRAGALTLAELTAVGLPAILVPYPYAVDDHQTVNAKYLEAHHAAVLLPQSELTPEKLSQLLIKIFLSPEKYALMTKASKNLNTQNSTQKIVELINTYL